MSRQQQPAFTGPFEENGDIPLRFQYNAETGMDEGRPDSMPSGISTSNSWLSSLQSHGHSESNWFENRGDERTPTWLNQGASEANQSWQMFSMDPHNNSTSGFVPGRCLSPVSTRGSSPDMDRDGSSSGSNRGTVGEGVRVVAYTRSYTIPTVSSRAEYESNYNQEPTTRMHSYPQPTTATSSELMMGSSLSSGAGYSPRTRVDMNGCVVRTPGWRRNMWSINTSFDGIESSSQQPGMTPNDREAVVDIFAIGAHPLPTPLSAWNYRNSSPM